MVSAASSLGIRLRSFRGSEAIEAAFEFGTGFVIADRHFRLLGLPLHFHLAQLFQIAAHLGEQAGFPRRIFEIERRLVAAEVYLVAFADLLGWL